MGFLSISKAVLVLIIPFLIFLGAANLIAFDKQYYARKMPEYWTGIPDANFLNEKTIDFIAGKSDDLPDAYNGRERQHLQDVRNAVKISRAMLYAFALLSISLVLASKFILKSGSHMANFTGKALAYGGILTAMLAGLLLVLISLDFASAFESFHKLFFRQGTYTFDPAKELIVNLYPEQIFMDIGLKILKWALLLSAFLATLGVFLIFKSKSKKNKNKQTKSGSK
jgi:integral membrane protein (TIGR01906 family)